MMRSSGQACRSGRSRRWLVRQLVPFLCLLAAATTASGRLQDGRLVVTWETTPFDGAAVIVQCPGGTWLKEPLADTPHGTIRFDDLVPGSARVELRDREGRTLRSWPVFVPAGLTTVVSLDAGEGTLRIQSTHPDPFGNVLTWSGAEFETLPGEGLAGVTGPWLAASALGFQLNGRGHGPATRLRPPAYNLDGDLVGVVTPLGGLPPRQTTAAVEASTDRAGRNGFRVDGAIGSGNEGGGTARLQLARATSPIGPIEIDGAFTGRYLADVGPLGFDVDTGAENDLKSLETRWTLYGRPLARGLARFDFHAWGQSRRHYLHEYRENERHAPREDRSAVRGTGEFELPAGPIRLSIGAGYARSFSKTGDGQAFDRIENYRIGTIENEDAIDDGYALYWRGSSRSISQVPHLFNYYTQDLATSWSGRIEGSADLGPDAPLLVGLEWERTTWRWYEHLDPIVDANIAAEGTDGYQYASYLGYTRDASDHADRPGHEAPQPRRLRAFADQSFQIGPARFEGGLRWSALSPDQKPLRDLDRPLSGSAGLADSDLDGAPTHSFVDPSFGAHLPFGRSFHLWADLTRRHSEPPAEMLYYSPNVLTQFATQDLGVTHPARYQTFGNPEVEPEGTTSFSAALGTEDAQGRSIRLTARLDQTSDTWVARRHAPSDGTGDSLAFYENHGNRRERSLRLDLVLHPLANSTLRGAYTLSERETDVIEPAPLYRALLLPDAPVQGTGTIETSPLVPLWFDDGVDRDWFPSLLDQTHRIAVSWTSRIGAMTEGTSAQPFLSDLDLTVGVRAASGFPYTWTYTRKEGSMAATGTTPAPALSPGRPIDENGNGVIDASEINSERMPWGWQVDVALRRGFRLLGRNFALAAEVRNVTNHRTSRLVYGATGESDDDGWLDSADGQAYLRSLGASANAFAQAYAERVDSPNRYDPGRTARATLSWLF